jgi:glycosyltransferase involved in cell wall biosynthesis
MTGPTPSTRQQLSARPLLSVVVPVYQAEDYLAECLESLLSQTHDRMQVIVVDDGSTDASADIALSFGRRDQRVVLVRQAHAGLGAARNTGLRRCEGELVAFADADDTVPRHAYLHMVQTLQRSGSDFVVGAILRSRSHGHRMNHRMKRWVRLLHERTRIGVRIDDAPEMLANVMPWSKMFRRDFLDALDLRFPEGILYEDQIPMTRAYLEAAAFDVIPQVVYRWRVRTDGNSITQRKAELSNLRDRITVQREIAGLLRRRATPEVERRWYVKTFRGDVPSYAKASVHADETYWNTFRDGVVALLAGAPADLFDELQLPLRLATWLIVNDHRQALGHLLEGALDQGRVTAEIPDELLRVRPVDAVMRSRLTSLEWADRGRLSVRCQVSVSHDEALGDPPRHHLDLVRVDGAGDATIRVPARVGRVGPEAEPVAGVEGHAFDVGVDLAALVEETGRSRNGRWALHPGASTHVTQVESRLHHRSARRRVAALGCELVSGALVRAEWTHVNGVVVDVRHRYALLVRAEPDADGLALDVRLRGLRGVDRIFLGATSVAVTIGASALEGTVRLRVPALAVSRPARLGVGSAKRSAPLLTLASQPPVLDDGGWITVDDRGRVVLDPPGEADREVIGEDLLLLPSEAIRAGSRS